MCVGGGNGLWDAQAGEIQRALPLWVPHSLPSKTEVPRGQCKPSQRGGRPSCSALWGLEPGHPISPGFSGIPK
jgi:hypothetical protein